MIKIISKTTIAVFFLSLLGCASSKVATTTFIDNPSILNKSNGLEKYYVDDNFNPQLYDGVLVDVKDYKIIHTDINITKINEYFKTNLIQNLRSIQLFNLVTESKEKLGLIKNSLICKVAITNLDPGDRMMRWFAGELGGGHTNVQIEGYFFDQKQNKEMFIFADRRIGAAAIDMTGGDSEALIKEDIRNITKEVAKVLKQVSEKCEGEKR